MTILNRKGAQKRLEIPSKVLTLLQQGQLATVNLVEWLAIDQWRLAQNTLPALGLTAALTDINQARQTAKAVKTLEMTVLIGRILQQHLAQQVPVERLQTWQKLAQHPSDSVRCWAAYAIGLDEQIDFRVKLTQIRPFAADGHFGVREIAWMAVRPSLSMQLHQGLELLSPWVLDADPNIRRFASELTRPRGVWCKQLKPLIAQPELGLPLLEPLYMDSAKYVQDSVGNWLNDASKSCPAWVVSVCETWQTRQPECKATHYIIKRALRSIKKLDKK